MDRVISVALSNPQRLPTAAWASSTELAPRYASRSSAKSLDANFSVRTTRGPAVEDALGGTGIEAEVAVAGAGAGVGAAAAAHDATFLSNAAHTSAVHASSLLEPCPAAAPGIGTEAGAEYDAALRSNVAWPEEHASILLAPCPAAESRTGPAAGAEYDAALRAQAEYGNLRPQAA